GEGALQAGRAEEVQFVADDGSADRRAVLEKVESARACPRRVLPHEHLILARREHAGLPPVRTRARYTIDERSGERALAHVEGRDEHLDLVERLERNGLGAGACPWCSRHAVDVTGVSAGD